MISAAAASRNPSQNMTMFSPSERVKASTVQPMPLSRPRPELASPDSVLVAIRPVPITISMTRPRRNVHGKRRRRVSGISHAELRAFCMARATPREPITRPITPTARAKPVCCSGVMVLSSSGPITG